MNNLKIITITLATMFFVASCGWQQSKELKFKTINIENFEKHPKAKTEKDGFSYKINLQYPSNYSDNAVLQKLQTKFIQYTLGKEYAQSVSESELKKSVENYIAVYKKKYNDNIKEMQKLNGDPNFVTGWHIECSNGILFMNETLLQLQTKSGVYPAESQAYENVTYHLFNLQTGKEYKHDDIFKQGTAENIRNILIPALLKQWNIKSLKEWGMEKNQIWTPETQFALTNKGITITHNDEMLGVFSVTFSYAMMQPFLEEGTPVWEVVSGKKQSNTAQKTQKVEQAEVAEVTNIPNPANILNVYKKVLNNEIKHFDVQKKGNIFLKDYFKDNNATDGEKRFAIVDLDGEGIPEIVIEHDPGIVRVLRFENGTVYGFSFDFRGMGGIKKDGSFEWANGAFNSGIGRQSFSETHTNCFHLSEESSEPNQDYGDYYIHYNNVNEQQYRSFMNIQYKKEEVDWNPFSTQNVNNLKEWDKLKYYYSSIPDQKFPIPKRNGVVIPYDAFSPPEEGWSITSYIYEDDGFIDFYKKQLREAGFAEDTERQGMWRFDRPQDGATLMVELVQENNQLVIQMYINYFN